MATVVTERQKQARTNEAMSKIEQYLLGRDSPTYVSYYDGKMSYKLHGAKWQEYVTEAFPDISKQQTSENVYKSVIDLYAENLVPEPDELRGFSTSVCAPS